MNITLNKKNINKKTSSVEIIILNKIKDLTQKEQELLNNINFHKKSFNTHFDIKNSKLLQKNARLIGAKTIEYFFVVFSIGV